MAAIAPVSIGSSSGYTASGTQSGQSAAVKERLTAQEENIVAKLAATDRDVRAHEAAHLAVAGRYATSGANYGYSLGPDGKLYATSGEVSMDVAPDPTDPEATIQKERVVEEAANAPVDPSSQDRMVAAQAAQAEAQAEQQLLKQQQQLISAYVRQKTGATGTLVSAVG